MDDTRADLLDNDADFPRDTPQAPPFRKVLAAPWLIIHLARAAGRMSRATRSSFWLSFGLGILALAVLLVFLVMWDETVSYSWSMDAQGNWTDEVYERGFGEVWREWHADGFIGPAELILLHVCFWMPIVTAVGAWLFLPNVHRGGGGWNSYKRSYRAVASGIGLLALETLIVGAAIVAVTNWEDQNNSVEPEYGMLCAIFCLGCGCFLLYWLSRATHTVAGPEGPIALPPMCEGCGYDLTHQPSDERCPECGLDIKQSLAPDVSRPGCEWQNCRDFTAWIQTTFRVTFSSSGFFRTLKLRLPGQSADRFAQWTYLAIAVYTICVTLTVFFIDHLQTGGSLGLELLLMPIVFSLFTSLICWITHRVVGAAVTSFFIVRQLLPDGRWAKTVMAYETAYLWVFCLYAGGLILSWISFEDWMSTIARDLLNMWIPVEPFVFLLGNGLIGLLWFRRYAIAYRNIRWSNF